MPDSAQNSPLILIIEDNPQDLRLLSNLVKDQGNIIFSTTGKEGLSLASQRIPDLILLDVELPDMEGFAVCKQIKANLDCHEIPIIFVTSHRSDHYEVLALESGAVDYITKPFNPPIVGARVKTHLTLKKQSDLLHSLAEIDGLTEVYNRRFFDQRAQEEWKRHMRQGQSLAIAIMDVDKFKEFNDHFGHTQGDICLKAIASTLKHCTRRPGEFAARYGGEEFICLLPNTNLKNAVKFGQFVCEKITALAIPHPYSDVSDSITLSVGVAATIPNVEISVSELITAADEALYLAKHSGRNCVRDTSQCNPAP